LRFRLSHLMIMIAAFAILTAAYNALPRLSSSSDSYISQQQVANQKYLKGWFRNNNSFILITARIGPQTPQIREEEGKGIWFGDQLIPFNTSEITKIIIDGASIAIVHAPSKELVFYDRLSKKTPRDLFVLMKSRDP
jgi:hypothetical protein